MARGLRIKFEGGLYHILARSNRRKSIFLDDEDRSDFGRSKTKPKQGIVSKRVSKMAKSVTNVGLASFQQVIRSRRASPKGRVRLTALVADPKNLTALTFTESCIFLCSMLDFKLLQR